MGGAGEPCDTPAVLASFETPTEEAPNSCCSAAMIFCYISSLVLAKSAPGVVSDAPTTGPMSLTAIADASLSSFFGTSSVFLASLFGLSFAASLFGVFGAAVFLVSGFFAGLG